VDCEKRVFPNECAAQLTAIPATDSRGLLSKSTGRASVGFLAAW
jgi:hypothetical protein